MARCNCSGSVCSCRIVDGIGTEVEGAGSPDSPYRINATGNIRGVFGITDTTTLDLHLTGEGTSEEAFNLSGDVTMRMSDLSDVIDPVGTPSEGEVPVWTTDHWEFKTPAAAAPGSVNVGSGLLGDGSSPNPLKVAVSGVWGQGTMAPNWPSDNTLGDPIYVDSAGQLRRRPTPIRHLDTGACVTRPNFRVDGSSWWGWGPINVINLVFTRTGPTINPGAGGDIGNQGVATLDPRIPPPMQAPGPGSTGPLGTMPIRVIYGQDIGMHIAPSGGITVNSLTPGVSMATGQQYQVSGMWLSNTGWPVTLPSGQFT